HHSGIALLTPYQVHRGHSERVTCERQEVLTQAYAQHPERFVRRPPKALHVPTAVWINPPPSRKEQNQAPTNSVPQSEVPGSPRNDDLESTRPVAPPETDLLATPREAERGGPSSQETHNPSPKQSSPQEDPPARPLPNNTTAFKPTAERKR